MRRADSSKMPLQPGGVYWGICKKSQGKICDANPSMCEARTEHTANTAHGLFLKRTYYAL